MTQLQCLCKKSVIYDETDPCSLESIYHPAHGWRRVNIDGELRILCPNCLKNWVSIKSDSDELLAQKIYDTLKTECPDVIAAAMKNYNAYIVSLKEILYRTPQYIPCSPMAAGIYLMGIDMSMESLYPYIREMAEKEKSQSPQGEV